MYIIIGNEIVVIETLQVFPLVGPAVTFIEYLSVDLFNLTGRSMCGNC